MRQGQNVGGTSVPSVSAHVRAIRTTVQGDGCPVAHSYAAEAPQLSLFCDDAVVLDGHKSVSCFLHQIVLLGKISAELNSVFRDAVSSHSGIATNLTAAQ